MAIPNNLSRFLLFVFPNICDWVYEEEADMDVLCGRLAIKTKYTNIFIWPYKKHMYLDKLIINIESKNKKKFFQQNYCSMCEYQNELIVVCMFHEKKDFLVCRHTFDLDDITTS